MRFDFLLAYTPALTFAFTENTGIGPKLVVGYGNLVSDIQDFCTNINEAPHSVAEKKKCTARIFAGMASRCSGVRSRSHACVGPPPRGPGSHHIGSSARPT